MPATTNVPGLFDFGVKREVIKTTALRAFPGWVVLTYRDEHGRNTYSASKPNGLALSPLEASFADAVYFAKHGEPAPR
jgi:hypothetical protein